MFTRLRMLFLSVPGIAFLLTSYRGLQDDPERGDVPGMGHDYHDERHLGRRDFSYCPTSFDQDV